MTPMTDEQQTPSSHGVFWEVPTPEAQTPTPRQFPGERVRKARRARNLSQGQLARLLGPNDQGKFEYHSTISNIERGRMNVPRHRVQDYARVLDLNPLDLMGENRSWAHNTPTLQHQTVEALRTVYEHYENPRFCPSCGVKLRP